MRPLRLLLAAAGLAALAFGVHGAFTGVGTNPAGHLRFLAILLVAHDGVVLPLALLVGVLLTRYVPPGVRGPVQGALLISATVCVIGIPLALGRGRRPDDPSALPGNYTLGLLAVLAAVWLATLAYVLLRRRFAHVPAPDRPRR